MIEITKDGKVQGYGALSFDSQAAWVTTRKCLICERLEFEGAKIMDLHTWICPECAEKIGKLIGVRTES